MHVPKRLPQSQDECQKKAQRIQRGGYVVPEELWIPEYISRLRIVISIPGCERQNRKQQRRQISASPISVQIRLPPPLTLRFRRETPNQLPCHQRERSKDGSLLGQRRH